MILDALILSLPARDSTVRMRAWRALKDAGCGVLRDGVYVLPASETASAALGVVESGIRSSGGFAMRVELHLKTDAQGDHLRGLFDRSSEYGALLDQIKAARPSRDYDGEYGASAADANRFVEAIQRSLTRQAGGRS